MAKKTYKSDEDLGPILKWANKINTKTSEKLKSKGLGFLGNYIMSQNDKGIRNFNKTGLDDSMIISMLKDFTRPARQGAVGLGIGASKLAGGNTSDYLRPGNQGIGDFSFLLDKEEQNALKEKPGKEALKSGLNVAGMYLTGGLSSNLGPAVSGIGKTVPRILAKGGIAAPGNIMQAIGMTEENKGENPVGAAIGAGVGSFAMPALLEGLSAAKGFGNKTKAVGKDLEMGLKGLKTEQSPTGLSTREQAFDQANEVVNRTSGKEKGLQKIVGMTPRRVNNAGSKLNSELANQIKTNKTMFDVNDIINEAKTGISGPLGIDDIKAGSRAQASINEAMSKLKIKPKNGLITTSQLADIKRFLQKDAYQVAMGKSTARLNNNKAVHDVVYNKLRDALGGKASQIYDDLDKLWAVAPDMMKNFDGGLMGTQYFQGVKVPALGQIVSSIGSVAGRGMQTAGKGISGLGNLGQQVSNIPGLAETLGGQLGRLAGQNSGPTQSSVQQQSTSPLGIAQGDWGAADNMGTQETVGEITMPTYDFGITQEQPTSGMNVDWNGLNMALMNAVASGQLSSSDAQYIVALARQISGQSGGSLQDQIGELAQTDPTSAKKLLAQAVLSGEIDSASANSVAKLYGLSAVGGSSKDINNAQSGLEDLATLESMIGSISLAPQVLGQGELSGAIGGSEYQQYQAAAKNVADLIARIRTGAQINEEEMKLYMGEFLPAWYESSEAKAAKLERIKNYFQGILSGQVNPSDIPAPKGATTPAQSGSWD